MAARRSINLLPKTEFEKSYWGKFLKWSLSSGRYIIILTEMVVILAFLSRFKLDRDLLDLSESISGKVNILEATYPVEQSFLVTQSRLNQAKEVLSFAPIPSDLLNHITDHVPAGMSIINLTAAYSSQTVTLSVNALSEQELGQFAALITQDKTWNSINIQSVSTTAGQGVTASIILSF